MTAPTLMVHLQFGQSNAGLLKIAAALAEQMQAGVVGIAACQSLPLVYSDAYIAEDVLEEDQEEVAREMKLLEAEFREALQGRAVCLEWRSAMSFTPLSTYLACEARCADLVLTCIEPKGSAMTPSRNANISDFVMQVGRPVLIVPAAAQTLSLDRVVIGWKETREARRATLDALPLLQLAEYVTVVEVVPAEEQADARARLDDVCAWLKWHGVEAVPFVSVTTGNDAAQFGAIVEEQAVGLVVAGAYGHSRVREWVLGGVTRELLLRSERCALVSH